jgi:predicted lipase
VPGTKPQAVVILECCCVQVEVRCYAFASPRVGNLAFAEHFKNKVHRALRFTHKKDIVPVVPPMG